MSQLKDSQAERELDTPKSAFYSTQVFNGLEEAHLVQEGQSALSSVCLCRCRSHPEALSQTHPQWCVTKIWALHSAVELCIKLTTTFFLLPEISS